MSSGTNPIASLRARRRAETAREIIIAAMEMFAAKGFEMATAEEIAKRAGVRPATFFNYFPRKEIIRSEFARARMERVRARLDGRRALSLDVPLLLLVSFVAENEGLAKQGRALLPQTILRPGCLEVLQPLASSLQKSLVAGLTKSGELGTDADSRIFAETFLGLYVAPTVQWAVHPDPPKGWYIVSGAAAGLI